MARGIAAGVCPVDGFSTVMRGLGFAESCEVSAGSRFSLTQFSLRDTLWEREEMRILLGFSYYQYPVDRKTWVDDWLGRLRLQGISVDGFCLTLDPPGPRLTWPELDALVAQGGSSCLRYTRT